MLSNNIPFSYIFIALFDFNSTSPEPLVEEEEEEEDYELDKSVSRTRARRSIYHTSVSTYFSHRVSFLFIFSIPILRKIEVSRRAHHSLLWITDGNSRNIC